MVEICGSDIPNLSKIVDDAFESVRGIYNGDDEIDFDAVETEVDVAMGDDLGDYIPDMSEE